MQRHDNDSRRTGMTTMEFALILPFLLAMVMVTIETGTMLYSWMTIQKAAQTGARFAATGQGDEEGTRLAQITAITDSWLENLDSGTKEITISSWPDMTAVGDGTTDDPGGPCQLVEVAVVYNYHPFTPVISALMPETIPLSGADRKLNEPWRPCE